jgi:hypothetical protein
MIGFQLLGGPHWVPLMYSVSLRGYDAGPAAGAPPVAWPWPVPDPEPESFPVQAATSRQTTATASSILSLSRIPVPFLLYRDPTWVVGSRRRIRTP